MLLRFQVENHASLRDEQELSLVADDRHEGRAERDVPRSRYRTVPVAAIYGPNASGKSNVIDAIAWMRDAVLTSFRRWDPTGGVPRRPFALRNDGAAHPSSYGVEFVLESTRYEYGFTVDDRRVLDEWLYSHSGGKPRRLYERRNGEPMRFGRGLTGRRKTIEELLRPNSLYLSVAAAQGHELLGMVFRWFREGLAVATDYDFQGRLDYTVKLCLAERERGGGQPLMGLLRFADLGVGGLEIHELERERKEEQERVLEALRGILGDRVIVQESLGERVRVEHRTPDGVFTLGLGEESSGTRTWIGLLGPVLSALSGGSTLCVDELDARLHPHLADALVGMFQSPEINTRGAQLLFSTHETSLLGRNSRTELFRDQVWFTEKDHGSGATSLLSMIDFKVRNSGENLEKRYLVGRYGAVPFFDGELLDELVDGLKQGDGGASGATGSQQEEGGPSGAEKVPHLL
ncbi:AAA family ATPase [Streptomyces mangrovi]|uniref:AAA family ATPase n=1 Tax=Streptomyces mangrovi TaxID=1206892 RepID=UPI00399CBAD4